MIQYKRICLCVFEVLHLTRRFKTMNSNKKIVIAAIVMLLAVFCVMSACKKNIANSGNGEVVVVTDENGVPITDENGEAVTVVLDTTIVDVTNENGELVYDEDGNVKTSVVYISKEVGIPVTDENGKAVTNARGEVLTTMIIVPPTTGGPVVTELPVTDGNGNIVTKPGGETVTYTMTYTTSPATPGDNSANWGSSYGGSGNDSFNDTAKTPDGGFVAVVQANSDDGSLKNLSVKSTPAAVVIKYDKNGRLQWQKYLPSNNGIILSSVDTDSSGNIIAAGYSKSTDLGVQSYGDYDAVIYKLNSSGDIQWMRSFGGSKTDGFYSVSASPDGSYIAAGITFSSDGNASDAGAVGSSKAIIVKYSSSGDVIFVRSFGGNGDTFNDVKTASDGSIYAVGAFQSGALFRSRGRADAGVVKLSSGGDTLWVKQYGGSGIDNFVSVTPANDGGCVIAGKSNSSDGDLASLGNAGSFDAVVVKYNGDGSFGWHTAVKGYFDEEFNAIEATDDGYVAVGSSCSSNRDLKAVGNRGGSDALVVTFSNGGSLNSIQSYGGSRDDSFGGVCVLSDGQIIACGSTYSDNGDLIGSKYLSNGSASMGMIARFK